MKETYDFRLSSEGVSHLFGSANQTEELLQRPNIARGVIGDDQYLRIAELDRKLRETKKLAFFSWEIKRTYSRVEIGRAELFLLKLRYKHASGEEFGTWYTDSRLEPDCGLGRKQIRILQTSPFRSVLEDTNHLRCALGSRQVGPLQIPFRELMKGRDIFSLWSGETVVSERLAKVIETGKFSGGRMQAIWNTQRGSKSLPSLADVPSGIELLTNAGKRNLTPSDRDFWSWLEGNEQLPLLERALWEQKDAWGSAREGGEPRRDFVQLIVQSSPVQVPDHTEIGDAPFDIEPSEYCTCESGKTRGPNLLSPLSIVRSSWDGSDICQTDLFFGRRQGLFRPHRHLVISNRLFISIQEKGIKGFGFEIVRLI